MTSGEQAKPKKEGGPERGLRWLRNINALGAVAFYGAGVAAGSEVLKVLGALNAAQAGFFEVARRWSQRRKAGKSAGRLALKPG